ncbi:MAG: sulfatase-like hydrolase/transferase [Planctomycetota bacterium]|nr:sulfatase-like hydrolase/transferase [Planctomycetota bacterium]
MPEGQHHLLLITTDQQRWDTIHAAGNAHIRTPHLNWLMDTGIQYARCYSDAPICMAARCTIMTGRHGYSNKYMGNAPNTPIDPKTSLPGILSRHGYQTRAEGKMHFSPVRGHFGFEHMEILDDYYRYMQRHPHLGVPTDHGLGQNEMEPGLSTVAESHSLTHWIVGRSVEFIETRDATRPFFLWTSFTKPHPPWDPCANYWQMYANADVPPPVRGDWSRSIEDVPQGFAMPTYHLNNAQRFSPELLRDCKRAYYACITQIDYNLGILFARMRELGILDRTTIVFTSDHGEMLGDHHLGAKSIYLEGSAHVPMIVRPAKGVLDEARGKRCDELVCLADLLPTFVNLAGARVPDGCAVDGLDLLGTYRGEARRERFFGQGDHFFAVVEGRYKYTFTVLGGGELLFDLETDPYERRELIRAGTHADVHARLKQRLAEHLAKQNHPAVQNGTLAATGPAPTAAAVRAQRSWPGFHSREEPAEVLH